MILKKNIHFYSGAVIQYVCCKDRVHAENIKHCYQIKDKTNKKLD